MAPAQKRKQQSVSVDADIKTKRRATSTAKPTADAKKKPAVKSRKSSKIVEISKEPEIIQEKTPIEDVQYNSSEGEQSSDDERDNNEADQLADQMDPTPIVKNDEDAFNTGKAEIKLDPTTEETIKKKVKKTSASAVGSSKVK